MEVTKLNKSSNPLSLIFGLMAGGVLFLGTATYILINRPTVQSQLEQLTVPVKEQTLTVEIQASGTVEPTESVNISPKNPGRLVKLLVEQGSVVKTGQPLAIMDNRELYAQGAEAEAKLKQAQASLQEAEVKLQGDIQVLSAQLAQALARLEEATQRIPRQIEQTRAQLREAEASLQLSKNKAQRNLNLMKEGAIS